MMVERIDLKGCSINIPICALFVPWWRPAGVHIWRLDHSYGNCAQIYRSNCAEPSRYLKQMNFDTIVHSWRRLITSCGVRRRRRVVIGTDYPNGDG